MAELRLNILKNPGEDDVQRIAAVVDASYFRGYRDYFEEGYRVSSENVRSYLRSHTYAVAAVAEDGNQMVATLLINLQEPNENTIMIHLFASDSSYKIPQQEKKDPTDSPGRRLLQFAEKWAFDANPKAQAIELEVLNQASSLIHYYERNGYVQKVDKKGEVIERAIPDIDQIRVTQAYQKKKLAYLRMIKQKK